MLPQSNHPGCFLCDAGQRTEEAQGPSHRSEEQGFWRRLTGIVGMKVIYSTPVPLRAPGKPRDHDRVARDTAAAGKKYSLGLRKHPFEASPALELCDFSAVWM